MELYPSLKEGAIDLYNDVEKRPEKVAALLAKYGADKVLARLGVTDAKNQERIVHEISQMTTISGLREKKVVLSELAAPYIEKAGCVEGRQELFAETRAYALPYAEKVLEPIEAKLAAGKDFAAPYISSVKESSAPYVAKLDSFRRSERVEAMVAAFQEARAHPIEKVGELKKTAVDLIKYENIKSYRDHVMSPEFQADTTRLVKVELPAVAAAAAKRGVETVKAKATSLAEEIESIKAKAKEVVKHGYEMANDVELESLRVKVAITSTALLAELQEGMAHIKLEGFSLVDLVERLKRVVAMFSAPEALKEEEAEQEAEQEAEECATDEIKEAAKDVTNDDKPPEEAETTDAKTVGESVSGSEEEIFNDARDETEDAALAAATPAYEPEPTLVEDQVGQMY